MKYLRLTSIGQGKAPSQLPLYIIDTPEVALEKGMKVILNGKLFEINQVVNKPGNPKTRISGTFL